MKIVIIGLSITSSWGNGHATTYRGLVKELTQEGHEVLFLEKDVPYYASNRDLPQPDYCRLGLYRTNEELYEQYAKEVSSAEAVIVGSYVQQGVEVGKWVVQTAKGVKAFYDIDTPVTLAKLKRGDFEYLHPDLIGQYDLYLSFSGGPILKYLEQEYGSPCARGLYCSVDPDLYYPEKLEKKWLMGYLGTYSDDRQPTVDELIFKPARTLDHEAFIVAGPQYPDHLRWPENVARIDHLAPAKHREFYNSQRFTLNVTRQDMIKAGYSPSVRLFEAAACGLPIISDYWDGLDHFFVPGQEILIAKNAAQVEEYFRTIDAEEAGNIGRAAREKILRFHTAAVRAKELEAFIEEVSLQKI